MVEADFQREYRLDLADEFERAGCRRLHALLAGLSVDSAVARGGKSWTLRDEIAATIAEQVSMWGNYHAQQWGGKKAPPPVGFSHPDRVVESTKKEPTTDPAEIAAFFGRLNGR